MTPEVQAVVAEEENPNKPVEEEEQAPPSPSSSDGTKKRALSPPPTLDNDDEGTKRPRIAPIPDAVEAPAPFELPPSIVKRVNELTASWKAVDQSIHHQLAPSRLLGVEERISTTALVIVLNHVPVATSGMGSPDALKAAKDAKALRFAKDKDAKDAPRSSSLRVTFVVARILAPGWGAMECKPNAPDVGNIMRRQQQQQPQQQKSKVPREKQARMHEGEHVFIHSFHLGAANKRTGLTAEFVALSPGMIFTTFAWDSEVDRVFSRLDRDILPFHVGIAELTTKAWSESNVMSILDLRHLTIVEELSAASRLLLTRSLASTSMQHAALMRERFGTAMHLIKDDGAPPLPPAAMSAPPSSSSSKGDHPDDHGGQQEIAMIDPRLPKGLMQMCLTKNFEANFALLHATPSSGIFVEREDGAILFQLTSGAAIADVPHTTFKIVFDERQFPMDGALPPRLLPSSSSSGKEQKQEEDEDGGDATSKHDGKPFPLLSDEERNTIWTTKLLNVALLCGAIELFVIVDSTPRNGNRRAFKEEDGAQRTAPLGSGTLTLTEEVMPATLVRVDVSAFIHFMLRSKPMIHESPSLPRSMQTIMMKLDLASSQESRKEIHTVAWSIDTNQQIVVNLRKMVAKKRKDEAAVQLLSSVLPRKAMWESGHRAFFFLDGKPRIEFLIPTQLPHGQAIAITPASTSMLDASMLHSRILPCISQDALFASFAEDADFTPAEEGEE